MICQCGCGLPVKFYRGKPNRFINGHNHPIRKSIKNEKLRCTSCNVELTDENWPIYLRKRYDHHCKKCRYSKDCATHKKFRSRIKEIVLNHYSNNTLKCQCCGEDDYHGLTIDHINNDGTEHRKEVGTGNGLYKWLIKNNFPGGFQVLCWNCNCIKYYFKSCEYRKNKYNGEYMSKETIPKTMKKGDKLPKETEQEMKKQHLGLMDDVKLSKDGKLEHKDTKVKKLPKDLI